MKTHGTARSLVLGALIGAALGFVIVTDASGQSSPLPDAGKDQGVEGTESARVVVYEEDSADPNGKRYAGTVTWRNENATPDRPSEIAVRADLEMPDRGMSMRFVLRRNSDPTLPASHTIDVVFTLRPEFLHGGVSQMPGILMKLGESARGTPLAGFSRLLAPGHALIGLSSLAPDQQRNIALLRDRGWFDLPIIYRDGIRAIIAFQKGVAGERALAQALAAWDAENIR